MLMLVIALVFVIDLRFFLFRFLLLLIYQLNQKQTKR